MDRAEARDAITQLIYDYARALDVGDVSKHLKINPYALEPQP